MNEFEARLIELDRAQHGLVAIAQLRDYSDAVLKHRARKRRELVRRGVLANRSVAPTFEQRVHAAVLSAGPTAFASHETAASLWKLPLRGPALLEITTTLDHRPILAGVRMHRSGLIEAVDTTTVEGIPVATPELAIYSVSSRFDVTLLGRMVDDGVRRGIVTLDRLGELVARLAHAPGRS
ncbi:MAG: hypothetical protein ACRDV7_00440, partial [Acidimicrobiia bacterium]